MCDSRGFTLIEVMVALGVFATAFIGFLMMTTTSVRGNADAFRVSSAGIWAEDRLEQLLRMPYDSDSNGHDDDGDGLNDNDEEKFIDRKKDLLAGLDAVGANADYSLTSPDGNYIIFWNVAEDEPEVNMKTVRVIVRNRQLGSDIPFTTIKILNE